MNNLEEKWQHERDSMKFINQANEITDMRREGMNLTKISKEIKWGLSKTWKYAALKKKLSTETWRMITRAKDGYEKGLRGLPEINEHLLRTTLCLNRHHQKDVMRRQLGGEYPFNKRRFKEWVEWYKIEEAGREYDL